MKETKGVNCRKVTSLYVQIIVSSQYGVSLHEIICFSQFYDAHELLTVAQWVELSPYSKKIPGLSPS